MKKRLKVRRMTIPEISNDVIVLPRTIKPMLDVEKMDKMAVLFIISRTMSKEWNKDNKELKKYKEFTDIILKHMTNNGWSNDYTIDFWNMNAKELKIVEKMFEKK